MDKITPKDLKVADVMTQCNCAHSLPSLVEDGMLKRNPQCVILAQIGEFLSLGMGFMDAWRETIDELTSTHIPPHCVRRISLSDPQSVVKAPEAHYWYTEDEK